MEARAAAEAAAAREAEQAAAAEASEAAARAAAEAEKAVAGKAAAEAAATEVAAAEAAAAEATAAEKAAAEAAAAEVAAAEAAAAEAAAAEKAAAEKAEAEKAAAEAEATGAAAGEAAAGEVAAAEKAAAEKAVAEKAAAEAAAAEAAAAEATAAEAAEAAEMAAAGKAAAEAAAAEAAAAEAAAAEAAAAEAAPVKNAAAEAASAETAAADAVAAEPKIASAVETLVDELKGADGEGLLKLLRDLSARWDDAEGDSAVALCAELRAIGAVPVICNLLAHETAQVHQLAIYIVGNLAAGAVDPLVDLSKRELKEAGAFDLLLRHLFSTDKATLLLALCAIQNVCVEIEYVDKLKAAGGMERLQHIVGLADPQLCQFAQGCFDNVRTVVAINAMQHMQQNFLRTRPKAEKAAAEAEAAEESAAEKAAADKAATGGAEPALAKPMAYRRQRSLRQKIRSSVVVETCIQTCIIVKEDQGSIGLDLQQSSGHRISIVRVKPDTPAARSVPPLVAGMAIVSVNGFPVLDAKVAAECIAKAGRGQMMLEVAPEATRSWLSRLRRASACQESVKGADEARMSGDEDSGRGAALAAEP